MKVLITGGCGFIASHIVEHHLLQNDEVWVVDDLSTGSLTNISSLPNFHKVIFDNSDICNWSNIDKAVSWADRIYNFAAVVGVFNVLANPVKLFNTNINGTERVLNAMVENQSSAHFILASSSSVYGHSDKDYLSEDDTLVMLAKTHPLSGYAASKIADEAITTAYANQYYINYTIVRFFNTVGPRQKGQYGMVVPRFVEQACNNKPITVFGNGEQTRSFCDVRDTVAMLMLLADNPKSRSQIVNVGNDIASTINHLAELVKDKAHSSSEIQHIDYSSAYGQMLSDIKQRRPNISKLRSIIHYEHQWTLADTVESLIEIYRQK
jgi:UDP-glucose 4-epimerase